MDEDWAGIVIDLMFLLIYICLGPKMVFQVGILIDIWGRASFHFRIQESNNHLYKCFGGFNCLFFFLLRFRRIGLCPVFCFCNRWHTIPSDYVQTGITYPLQFVSNLRHVKYYNSLLSLLLGGSSSSLFGGVGSLSWYCIWSSLMCWDLSSVEETFDSVFVSIQCEK